MLEIGFSDGCEFRIPFELMRVYSPSAEVQGHGPGQEVLQTGKREVDVVSLEPVGNYAVQPVFSDGHSSGIFTWDYLYFLGVPANTVVAAIRGSPGWCGCRTRCSNACGCGSFLQQSLTAFTL
jgi:DUF971 family protein